MRHAIPESKTLLSEMNIEVFCTTDDLTSSLETHEQAESALDTDVRPTWGLDRALHIGRNSWHTFVDQLEHATDTATSSFLGFLEAFEKTHNFRRPRLPGERLQPRAVRNASGEPTTYARHLSARTRGTHARS
ncbi:hypothetical protein B2G88_16705 [Natronolimnobius baerhuensis]|uniref:Uronate isomerase n=1 Tax=Natronolimnobius baerhuensis TaxID=253108 RepID=A0A202E425_9EURY|nr:glucuronate isomerase [Natronolimnobius baerhuensis]OVE83056.1 hypothetical protein B2G88_16705 [Natronolimnobius baerhuensis]